MERRTFLASLPTAHVLGANDRIRVGVIGTGGRGQYLLKELLKNTGVDCVAVCDVYDVRRAQARQIAGGQAEMYLDHKQVVERKDVDAVIVATPDHWHASIAVDALNAGKDVYVEKPMVHFPKDGQAIVKAVRANKRVLQVGTQGRGLQQFIDAKTKYIDSGVMGKVGMARAWYMSNAGYVQTAPPGHGEKARRVGLGALDGAGEEGGVGSGDLLQSVQVAALRRRDDHGHRDSRGGFGASLAGAEGAVGGGGDGRQLPLQGRQGYAGHNQFSRWSIRRGWWFRSRRSV